MICHIRPNQVQSFSYPGEAWRWAIGLIDRFGEKVVTEDGQQTKEIRNLMVQIENPLNGWPIESSGWDLPALMAYTEKEILGWKIPEGFRYTYGSRLMDYDICRADYSADQIKYVIHKLERNPTSRRAIAITWRANDDWDEDSVPCLQLLDFLIRGEALHCTAVFRSWDVARAGPANMYGIAQLQKRAANEIGAGMGSLTIVAVAAHVYEEGQ